MQTIERGKNRKEKRMWWFCLFRQREDGRSLPTNSFPLSLCTSMLLLIVHWNLTFSLVQRSYGCVCIGIGTPNCQTTIGTERVTIARLLEKHFGQVNGEPFKNNFVGGRSIDWFCVHTERSGTHTVPSSTKWLFNSMQSHSWLALQLLRKHWSVLQFAIRAHAARSGLSFI